MVIVLVSAPVVVLRISTLLWLMAQVALSGRPEQESVTCAGAASEETSSCEGTTETMAVPV
jgi:hypothetical protein